MAKGSVKWFNSAKGYGFIREEGQETDIFVHYSAVQMDGYKSLKNGDEVKFKLIEGPRGPHALDVTKVLPPEES
jgi:CspA family cold shock protein